MRRRPNRPRPHPGRPNRPGRRTTATADGAQGAGSAGLGHGGTPTFVLVHGTCASSLWWADLTRELSLRGYRTVAVDLPGHEQRASSRSPTRRRETWRRWRQCPRRWPISRSTTTSAGSWGPSAGRAVTAR
ncbi:alpha/beta fold hydrolase [Actinomadura madurae]|uniref:alpha/beta fold hydrolase n=1 Tax=Actinomadura madurae TaxID=1993 RepID=UPI003D6A9FB0